MKDLLGLGKVLPIDKLIGIIENVTGRLAKGYFDKKDVDTRAYEIIKLTEASANAKATEIRIIAEAIKKNSFGTGGIGYKEEKIQITSSSQIIDFTQIEDIELEKRTKDRLLHQHARKQLNIESITAVAAEQLKNESEIENGPIDEDWISRFFNIIEDVSSDELQALWGKVLAGEIKRPKSYSLRTLELIRNLSKDEATVIMKIANYAIKVDGKYSIFDIDQLIDKEYLTYFEQMLLIEIGLIQPNKSYYEVSFNSTNEIVIYGDWALIIEQKQPSLTNAKKLLPVTLFTIAGAEILQLLSITESTDYLKSIVDGINDEETIVKYGKIGK